MHPLITSITHMTRCTLSVLLLFVGFSVMAQQPPAGWCGTREMSPWFRQYRDQWDLTAGSRGLDTNWLYVPMTIHLVGNDEGAGYFPINQAMRALCDMNAQYAPSYIRFYD
jgi:hypothetical protein